MSEACELSVVQIRHARCLICIRLIYTSESAMNLAAADI